MRRVKINDALLKNNVFFLGEIFFAFANIPKIYTHRQLEDIKLSIKKMGSLGGGNNFSG